MHRMMDKNVVPALLCLLQYGIASMRFLPSVRCTQEPSLTFISLQDRRIDRYASCRVHQLSTCQHTQIYTRMSQGQRKQKNVRQLVYGSVIVYC